ncbi:MAG: MerR family transcriptional regulator [Pseudobdellovibrionaceae bacterium]
MEKTKKSFSTADLMKTFAIGRNTLRLYEEMGLLVGMKRTEAKYRQYGSEHFDDLKFTLEAKKVGFTLSEIKTLLDVLRKDKKVTCGSIAEEITGKVKEIDEQVSILKQKKQFLGQFLETCKSNNPANKCDVIGAGFDKKACCPK